MALYAWQCGGERFEMGLCVWQVQSTTVKWTSEVLDELTRTLFR